MRRHWKHRAPKAIATVIVTALAITVLAGAAPAPPTGAASGRSLIFGAAQRSSPGVTNEQAVTRLESSIGRRLAAIRVYDNWDSTFPDAFTTWLRQTGHTVFLSVKPRRADGTPIPWATIANARPGDPLYNDMVRWADNVKAFHRHMYLAFSHEPDITPSRVLGSASDFIAAWRVFVGVLRSQHVANVEYAWTVAEGNFFHSDVRYPPKYYPGDAYVDDIAADAYNMHCPVKTGGFWLPWMSLQQVLAPLMKFATLHPRQGLIIAEWGSPEDPSVPGRKAQWITDVRQLFKQPAYQRVKAVLYWNQTSSNFGNCDFRVSTSATSLAAFSAMGKDPFYSATP